MKSKEIPGALLLEDGSIFHGAMAAPGTRFGEVVFNTSMTGYQEILTDPSYCGQIVVMTVPHVGNYGMQAAVSESRRTWVEGFIARQFTAEPSNFGSEGELPKYLADREVPALHRVDTRAIVRRVRETGALRGVVTDRVDDLDQLAKEVEALPSMVGRALVEDVTCAESYELPATGEERYHLAVYDFGAKRNILRALNDRGARLTVLPAGAVASDCLDAKVDGVVLSNGPGDPEPLTEIQSNLRQLLDADLPLFGICLGHQLLGLAVGGQTFKLKFGHHGGNQPVRDLTTGQVFMTSQNHGFAVEGESLPEGCRVSQLNLNDGTVEGFVVDGRPVFSAQYHPEAAPGPHEASAMFDEFLSIVESRRRSSVD